MYEGTLRDYLDSNIPYLPHVTVAAKTDHAECVALAEELDALGVSLEGRIDAVEVVSIDADVLTTLAVVALGGVVTYCRGASRRER
jgi:2'-5' RNA ligase